MHYDPTEVLVATGIRNFKPPLLAIYREYIQDKHRRAELHNILEALKAKGYKLPEPKYKRYPREFDKDDPYVYLSLFGSLYVYTTFEPDEVFHSEEIVYRNFKIYEDMMPLHEWVYGLSLYGK